MSKFLIVFAIIVFAVIVYSVLFLDVGLQDSNNLMVTVNDWLVQLAAKLGIEG